MSERLPPFVMNQLISADVRVLNIFFDKRHTVEKYNRMIKWEIMKLKNTGLSKKIFLAIMN